MALGRTIDPGSPVPLYAQLESILAAEIAVGTLSPGSRLPNEEELVGRYAVSRTTVRQTIQNLVRRGLIEIRRGKGTFVLEPKITQELTELSGFVEDMQSLGRHASARLLGKQTVPANESVARQLAIKSGTPVVRIQRVRLADKSPLSFDETYLPSEIGERILENDLEMEPIFSLLEQKYNTPLVEAEYRLEAVSADLTVARALSIAVGSPIFLIERTSYTTAHQPVDYEKLYYRGDQIRFVTRLARKPRTEGDVR
ncbi:MAG: GntR family transcriptional regulator [Acidobacteriaceae bacterium]|nr:GntR family transcriptional regulator [Acidobacteriaceae bacterium]MBV9442961.1 GntR family transcriptional regulator [Acidobacteriaceae bacterium]